MKKLFALISVCCLLADLNAQVADTSFISRISLHREQYKAHFLTDPRSPLSAKDTAYLDFYPAEQSWSIPAHFTPTPDAPPFDMLTYSGVTRLYQQYGKLDFEVAGVPQQLLLYRNLTLIAKDSSFRDYIFLPFKDLTNAETTYGGGRYLDFRAEAIQNDTLLLDFNKCYNPWCAYSDGYNCPIPPKENHLKIAVPVGEKVFLKKVRHE